jgi:hypothetical protein
MAKDSALATVKPVVTLVVMGVAQTGDLTMANLTMANLLVSPT